MDISQTAAGGGLVVVITAVASYFTQRAASNAATKNTETTSRTQIEQDAFSRAEGYLERTITRLEDELAAERSERAAEVAVLRSRVAKDETALTRVQRAVSRLQGEAYQWRGIAQVIARWALTLRDELVALGGNPGPIPAELATLQAIDAAADLDRAEMNEDGSGGA